MASGGRHRALRARLPMHRTKSGRLWVQIAAQLFRTTLFGHELSHTNPTGSKARNCYCITLKKDREEETETKCEKGSNKEKQVRKAMKAQDDVEQCG